MNQSLNLDKSGMSIPDLQKTRMGSTKNLFGATAGKNSALQVAKQKIEQFMISQDVTLSMLFNVIDTNSDNSLSK
jgi:hypothetical protein